MTKDELYSIKRYLGQEYSYQDKIDRKDIKDYNIAKLVVEREIRLKEMDPRKSEDLRDNNGTLMDDGN